MAGSSAESENRCGAFLKRKSTAFLFLLLTGSRKKKLAVGSLRKIGIEGQAVTDSQNYPEFIVKLYKKDETGLTMEITGTIMRIYFINTIYNYIYK